MDSKTWLLVEWFEDNTCIFSTYAVVNYDSLVHPDTNLAPGSEVLVHNNMNTPQRARIVRISECEGCMKKQKETLELRDLPFKKLQAICMETIKKTRKKMNKKKHKRGLFRKAHSLVPSSSGAGTSYSSNMAENCNCEESNNLPDSNNCNLIELRLQQEQQQLYRVQTREQRRKQMDLIQEEQLQHQQSFSHEQEIVPYEPLLERDLEQEQLLAQCDLEEINRLMGITTPQPVTPENQPTKTYNDQESQTDFPNIPGNVVQEFNELEKLVGQLVHDFTNLLLRPEAKCSFLLRSSKIPNTASESVNENERGEENQETHAVEYNVNMDPGPSSSRGSGRFVKNHNNARTLQRKKCKSSSDDSMVSRDDNETVTIGDGNAKIPRRIYKDIDWKSCTLATRQLLMAVFRRSDLATHSLSGKGSPAFMDKDAKKILDPKLIEDIVKEVSTKCNVLRNKVRKSITLKCADEAKLFRARTAKLAKRQKRKKGSDAGSSSLSPEASTSKTPEESTSKSFEDSNSKTDSSENS